MTEYPLPAPDPTAFDGCSVVELRQYTLHPHRRDTLIELFDRELVETQEDVGMQVIGQFRDVDDPDRFVWLRGFAGMAARRRGLEAFYGGPVWAAHRAVANATMIDSDNVLLLRPAWQGAASSLRRGRAADRHADRVPPGAIALSIFYLREPAGPELLAWCRDRMVGAATQDGALQQAWYLTESSPNDFVRLPVRQGEHVLVRLAVFADAVDLDRVERHGRPASELAPSLSKWLSAPPELHRLTPTARSAVHA